MIQEAKYYLILEALRCDWLFRQRFRAARCIQALIRGFNARCLSIKVLQQFRKDLMVQLTRQRQILRQQNQARKQAIIHKEVRMINSVQLMIIISRKDLRTFARDLSLVVNVYTPESQKYSSFVLEEPRLREFIRDITGITDATAISIGDLYSHKNLKAVLDKRYVE